MAKMVSGFGMNEVRRLATLEAMGIQSYISRSQLPGAALTRRLAIVGKPRAVEATTPAAVAAVTGAVQRPIQATVKPAPAEKPEPARPVAKQAPPRFALGVIVAAQWLWLEELPEPQMRTEQLQLIQAMAFALGGAKAEGAGSIRPEVEYFNWPLHTNQQLDQGIEAARSGVSGFIQRRLEQRQCRGLILLGARCAARVALEQLSCPQVVSTQSTARMLAEPLSKQQAWRDLRAVYSPA